MNEGFGMMDQAYFVSRNEIIKWINQLLKVSIDKIESLGNGAAYCQVMDAIFPGEIQLSKVNWNAKLEHECLANYKILQNCFIKKNIQKVIEVNKLVKCKYQDNLEFAQWVKKFFDSNCGDRASDYNAEERRHGAKLQAEKKSQDKDKKVALTSKLIQPTISSQSKQVAKPPTTLNGNMTSKTGSSTVNTNPLKRNLNQVYGNTKSNTNLSNKTKNEDSHYESLVKKIKSIVDETQPSDSEKINLINNILIGSDNKENICSNNEQSVSEIISAKTTMIESNIQQEEQHQSESLAQTSSEPVIQMDMPIENMVHN